MRNVSNAFKEKMKDRRDFYATAEITFTDGTIKTLSKADFNIKGNTVVQGAATSSFPLGVLSSKQITLSLLNSDEQWADYDFYGAKIKLFTNFQLNDEPFGDDPSFIPSMEVIREGEFTVITPETYGTTVEITAMDESYKVDQEYNSTLLFPAALDVALLDCCSTCGITLYSSDFPNKNFIIKEKPTDITFRQFIAYTAMIAGGNAVLDEYNRLKIMPYDLSPFDEEEGENVPIIKEFKLGLNLEVNDVVITGVQTTGEVTTSVTDEDGNVTETTEEKTYQYGEEGYMLSVDNALVKGNEQEFINAVGQKLVGLKFRPFSGDSVANPLFEFMDCVYIQDIKGKQYQTIITDVDFTYFSFTGLKCTADSPLRVNRKYENAAAQAIIKARELVEQEKTEREKAIDRLNQMLEGSSGFYLTEDKQDDGSVIMYIHDKPTIEESKYVVKITGEAMAISNDGGETYIYGLSYDGEAILRKIYAEGIDADYITTGHLLADLIQGGTLTLGGLNNQYGLLKILDDMGTAIGEWGKNGIEAKAGAIGGFTIDSEKIYAQIREGTTSTSPLYLVLKGNDSFFDRSFLKKYWKTLDGMDNALDHCQYKNADSYRNAFTNGAIFQSLKLTFTADELKGLTCCGEQIDSIYLNHESINSNIFNSLLSGHKIPFNIGNTINWQEKPSYEGTIYQNFKAFPSPNVWFSFYSDQAQNDVYTPTGSYLPNPVRTIISTGFYPCVRFLANSTVAEYPSNGYYKSEWWCQIIEEGGRKALKLRNKYTDTKINKVVIEWEWFYCDDETEFFNIIECADIGEITDQTYQATILPSICHVSPVVGVEIGNKLKNSTPSYFASEVYPPVSGRADLYNIEMIQWGYVVGGDDYLKQLSAKEYGFLSSSIYGIASTYSLEISQSSQRFVSLLDNKFFYKKFFSFYPSDLNELEFKYSFFFNGSRYKSNSKICIGALCPNALWRNAVFESDESGNIKATSGSFENVTIKGTLKTGSTFGGTLNYASGTFTGELVAAKGTFLGTLTTGDLSNAGFKIENGRILGYKNNEISSYFSANATFTVDDEVLPAIRIASYGGLALYGKHLGVCRDFVDVGEGGTVDMGGNGTIQVITGIELVDGELNMSYRNLRFTNGVMTTAL